MKDVCDISVRIDSLSKDKPSLATSSVGLCKSSYSLDSLNVSVATGILLYQLARPSQS